MRQSGSEPARHGRISKQGPGETRHVLVEAAWHAARTSGPLRAFHERIATRRGSNIATIAVARKLAVIAWHMLCRGEDYAFARPSLTREKIRKLELATGAQRQKGKRIGRLGDKAAAPARQGARRPSRAHSVGRQAAKQRGRRQPHLLRFSSRSPAPNNNSRKGAATPPAT